MTEKAKKNVVTSLEEIPSDLIKQAEEAKQEEVKPAEATKAEAQPAEVKPEVKPVEPPVRIRVKRLEVREKKKDEKTEGKPAEAKPAEAPKTETSSMTMAAVEKELAFIKQRLSDVERGQASAETRLKAIEANGESIAQTLAKLGDIQAKQAERMEEVAADADEALKVADAAEAKAATARKIADKLDQKQQAVAAAVVEVRQRQTPWGMFAAWRERRRQHAEAERRTMQALRRAEYEHSVDAVANGDFAAEPAEA